MKKKSAFGKLSETKSKAASCSSIVTICKPVETNLPESDDYRLFIEELKQRVLSARIFAARAVTHGFYFVGRQHRLEMGTHS